VRPQTFDLARQSELSHWVLLNGLPEPPGPHLDPDQAVPVAYWVGPDTAAVLHIRRYVEEDEAEPRDIVETDIDVFCLVDGIWEIWGGGGGGWAEDEPLSRIDVPARHVSLGGMYSSGVGGRGAKTLWGEVGTDAAVAEVAQDGVVTRRHVHAPTGAFVVSGKLEQPFTVRIFDAAGELLAEIEEPAGFDDTPAMPRFG
jgi:hypothetical protein